MSLLGNILWLVFGGLIAGLGYILGGLLTCITIIGIPFGIQAMKIGVATFTPFGKKIVELPDANSALRLILNVIWLVVVGWEIALAHAVSALVLAITIIGIPFAMQHLKLIPLALLPFGRTLS
ncbi:MAG TPA: YccF domain-containing protein [Vicinamibacteria bacterium]|nr:YccF domain-containing protein [Vicinamibacteria bacterium]